MENMEKIRVRDLFKKTENYIDKEITIEGFVDNIRDLQYVQFLIVRDSSGKLQVTIEKNEENALNESVQEYTNDSPINDTKSNPIFDLISIILILFVVGLSIYSLKYNIDQRPKAVDYDIDSNSTAIPFDSVVE